MMRFHTGHRGTAARIEQGRALIEFLVGAGAGPAPYMQALGQELAHLQNADPGLVFHDDLAEVNEPCYFHEFVAHAARFDLQFLAEAALHEMQDRTYAPAVAAALRQLGDDVLTKEQYIDFMGRRFRQSLLCRADAPVRRELRVGDLGGLWVSSPAVPAAGAELDGSSAVRFALRGGESVETADPAFKRLLARLGAAWPAAVPVSELGGDRPQRVGEALLEAHAERIVDLHVEPPPLRATVSERPVASPLARRQAAAGRPLVTSLLHDELRIDELGARELLASLDGTRSARSSARMPCSSSSRGSGSSAPEAQCSSPARPPECARSRSASGTLSTPSMVSASPPTSPMTRAAARTRAAPPRRRTRGTRPGPRRTARLLVQAGDGGAEPAGQAASASATATPPSATSWAECSAPARTAWRTAACGP